MLRLLQKSRFYCTQKNLQKTKEKKRDQIDFTQLNNESKIPNEPVYPHYPEASNNIEIDNKTIQLLERLALVDLDSKEALATLKSSIQFADKIVHIDTSNVKPLYTVLEWQQLQLRNDQVTEGNCREQVLRIAKVTDEDYYVAPPGNIPLEQGNTIYDTIDNKEN